MLRDFPYSAERQRREAMLRATKMSIQGVQPKLSAVLNVKSEIFELVDRGGIYIVKPQHDVFPEVPENEDVTMKMAASCGIEVPLHGLIHCIDQSLSYVIKRFDRVGRRKKCTVEDFAQLMGKSRDTKYDASMEQIAKTITQYCTFPVVEHVKLFRRVLFNFLTGNEDMHLKNWSLIRRKGVIELSPAYDLLSSTLTLEKPAEEIALPLGGKKRRLTRESFFEYYAKDRLQLSEKAINTIEKSIRASIPHWMELIRRSFLSESMKQRYRQLLDERLIRLGFV
jgi:serine/threonine-protein kinase HipA